MPPSNALPIVVTAPWQVDQALREIGLTRGIVRAVAIAAAGARADALAVDPNGTPGQLSYIHGVRTIRLMLLPFQWEVARNGNVESTVNHKLGVQLFFQNVHRACGDSDPEAISNKGSASRNLVKSGQGSLFGTPSDTRADQIGQSPTVWIICVSADENSVRAEVSCPEVFEGDQFDGFVRRLIVVDESFDPKPTSRRDSDDDDGLLDVAVTKK
jgi:hypothetical protein